MPIDTVFDIGDSCYKITLLNFLTLKMLTDIFQMYIFYLN